MGRSAKNAGKESSRANNPHRAPGVEEESKMLTEDEKRAIDMFLAENWSEFEDHCATHGVDEDQIADKLSTD